MILSDRFSEALSWAHGLHRTQMRKGHDIPYISHLLRVAGLALEFGADEDTAIAALLHDAVEDQGGMKTAREIESRFGKRVRKIVLECSDSTTGDSSRKRPWRERKENYLQHLRAGSDEAGLISACDKIDNLTAICRDLDAEGPSVFERFTGGRAGTVWYYEQVAQILIEKKRPGAMELAALLTRLKSALSYWDSLVQKVTEVPTGKLVPPENVESETKSEFVLLGLGSNQGNRRKYLEEAVLRLKTVPNLVVHQVSSLYETLPQGGPEQQRNYYNAVVLIETTLTPRELLASTQEIETQLHRVRRVHWGPRTMDIDILLYGEKKIRSKELVIPHPRWDEREFVLVPAVESLWNELNRLKQKQGVS